MQDKLVDIDNSSVATIYNNSPQLSTTETNQAETNQAETNQAETNQAETELPWYEANNQLKKFAPKNNETPENALQKLANSYIELEKKLSSQMSKIPAEYNIDTADVQLADKTVHNLLTKDEIDNVKAQAKLLKLTQDQCQTLYHYWNKQKNILADKEKEIDLRRQERIKQNWEDVMGGNEGSGEWQDSMNYISAISNYGIQKLNNNIDNEKLVDELDKLCSDGAEVVKLLRVLGKDYLGSESNLRMKERTAGFYGSTPPAKSYSNYSNLSLGEEYMKLVQSEAFRNGDTSTVDRANNIKNILQARGALV